MPATSQLDWLSSTTAMIVLFWSRATRDLLKSFGWGIAALHRLHAATKLPSPRRPPHRISQSHRKRSGLSAMCTSNPISAADALFRGVVRSPLQKCRDAGHAYLLSYFLGRLAGGALFFDLGLTFHRADSVVDFGPLRSVSLLEVLVRTTRQLVFGQLP